MSVDEIPAERPETSALDRSDAPATNPPETDHPPEAARGNGWLVIGVAAVAGLAIGWFFLSHFAMHTDVSDAIGEGIGAALGLSVALSVVGAVIGGRIKSGD